MPRDVPDAFFRRSITIEARGLVLRGGKSVLPLGKLTVEWSPLHGLAKGLPAGNIDLPNHNGRCAPRIPIIEVRD